MSIFLTVMMIIWWIAGMIYTYQIAESRGFERLLGWLLAAALLGPIAMIAVALIRPSLEDEDRQRQRGRRL